MGMGDYRFRGLFGLDNTYTNGLEDQPQPPISLSDGYSKSVYPVDIEYWIIGAGGGGGAGHGAYLGGGGTNGSAGGTTSISSSAFTTISAAGGGGGLTGVTLIPPVSSVSGAGGPGQSLDILFSGVVSVEAGSRVTSNDAFMGRGGNGGLGPGPNQYYTYSGGGGGGGGGAGGAGGSRQGSSTFQAAAAEYKTGTISAVPGGTVITVVIGAGGAGGTANPSYYAGGIGSPGTVRLKIGGQYYAWNHVAGGGTYTLTL